MCTWYFTVSVIRMRIIHSDISRIAFLSIRCNFLSSVGDEIKQYMYNNFEISLVVFMPNITTNHAITYTYLTCLT